MNSCYKFPLLLLIGLSGSLNAAETVFVSSKQAKIYEEASFSSTIIASLKQNDAIELLDQKGIWMQVSNPDISGWLSQYSVTATEPFEGKISIFDRLINFFSNNQRDRMVLVSTAGGVRGFSARISDTPGSKDFESVAVMESVGVSEADIEKFITDNKN